MAKKRAPVDAFGLSLLDVLSNALGGLILLMMIVAITLKGNDKKRLNLPKEETQGKKYTDVRFQKTRPEAKYNLLLAQIRLYGSSTNLKLSGDITNCSLSKSTSNKDLRFEDWLVLRTGEKNTTWSLRYQVNGNLGIMQYPDSIGVMVTLDERVYCSKIIKRFNRDKPILEVEEEGKSDPKITVAGLVSCPTN